MIKHYFWCFTLLHDNGLHSRVFFEANSLDSFPDVKGRIINVTFNVIENENS